MNPEIWEELKEWGKDILDSPEDNLLQAKMTELERRELPKRVAEIMKNTDIHLQWCSPHTEFSMLWCSYETLQEVWNQIIHALETGDTSEIERWEE
ncbi:MAG: hypothetical protein V1685_04475 [Parcubacteria group bacterium]